MSDQDQTQGRRTPGPWVMEFTGEHAATRDGYYEIAPIGDDGEPDWSREVAATTDDNKANACLLVAAPDLLDACELVYVSLLRLPITTRLTLQVELCALRESIARATDRGGEVVQDEYEAIARMVAR